MPDLKYRYLAEDVPTGLCFAKGLAEILDIKTPTIDKVMTWAQKCIELEILVDGKMKGKDIGQTRAPQALGVTTFKEFAKLACLKADPGGSGKGATKPKKGGKKVYDYSGLEAGKRVQVESGGVWYAADVVQVSTSKSRSKAPVKVTYKGYDGYDEWVSGERLRSKLLKVES